MMMSAESVDLQWSFGLGKIEHAPVAQLDRVLASEAKGHRFESCRVHHIFRNGLIRAIRPGGDTSVKSAEQRIGNHAADELQRNGVLVFHMAWRMTAILRATAMRAFLNPETFASFRPHAFSVEKRRLRVNSVVAAS